MNSKIIIPPLTRPASGVGRHRIYFLTFDADLLADPVANAIFVLTTGGRLESPQMTRQSQGVYWVEWLTPAGDTQTSVRFNFTWRMGRIDAFQNADAPIEPREAL